MSTYYNFYTEAKIGDVWHCIDPKVLRLGSSGDPYKLTHTYWSGSRSYFGEAHDKLMDISSKIRFDDTSSEFRTTKTMDWRGSGEELAPYYDSILRVMPYWRLSELNDRAKKPEYCGLYKNSDIELYESDELEDLFEREISPEAYSKLVDDARRIYRYYEWNYATSWRRQIPRLFERVVDRIREFENTNYIDCDEVRILMYLD